MKILLNIFLSKSKNPNVQYVINKKLEDKHPMSMTLIFFLTLNSYVFIYHTTSLFISTWFQHGIEQCISVYLRLVII